MAHVFRYSNLSHRNRACSQPCSCLYFAHTLIGGRLKARTTRLTEAPSQISTSCLPLVASGGASHQSPPASSDPSNMLPKPLQPMASSIVVESSETDFATSEGPNSATHSSRDAVVTSGYPTSASTEAPSTSCQSQPSVTTLPNTTRSGQAPEPHSGDSASGKSRKTASRLAKLEDAENMDELLEGVYDNEEELVDKLMQQLQGLSHKQQRLYGIWDGTTDGGKRAFVEQWRRRHAERRAMVAALRDPATPPTDRMALRTSYILNWRKVLFSCPRCWLLPGLCVCDRMQRFTPQRTQVVVQAHHGEWGSASNSGCILTTSLEGSEMLLQNHPDHDRRLQELMNDPTRTTALLWPGSESLLPEQLSALAAERTGGRITVVALDATWGNARRMYSAYPRGTLTVRLPPESTLKENKLSLLRPVRRYRGDLDSGRVSTVEAVAALLYELEGDDAMYRGLLDNLKIKVDACRLQKNRSLVYDTHTPEERSARHRWRGRREEEGKEPAAAAGAATDGSLSGQEDT